MAKYKELLGKTKDEKEAAEVDIKVKEAAIQVDYDLLAATKAVNDAENRVNNLKKSDHFSPVDIIEAVRDLEDAKADLKALQDLKSEMFD